MEPPNREPAAAPDPLLEEARSRFGISALFPYQRLVIQNILEAAEVFSSPGEDRDTRNHQIVILPTGAGKSLCFMLPGGLLPGMTLVVFPLLALMGDQLRRLNQAELPSVILKGGQSPEDREEIRRKINSGSLRFILTNPETLKTEAVQKMLSGQPIIHGVIDEAHTVSEWGKTFRPAYLELGECIHTLNIPVITAFTATASPEVLQGIQDLLFPGSRAHLIMGNPDRENISYRVMPTLCAEADLARLLLHRLPDGSINPEVRQRPAIVFCSSRTSAELTALDLRIRSGDPEIYFYHAGLSREEKARIEEWFFDSADGILCSTCAYGMGVDKQNIRTVIHRDPPSTVESYLQESGRGGRDRQQAEAILLLPYNEENQERKPEPPGVTAGDSEFQRLQKQRKQEFLEVLSDSRRCRREALLSLLGADSEYCAGCDICLGTNVPEPAELKILISFFKKFPGRFDKRQIRFLLAGSGSVQIRDEGLFRNRFFGAMKHWYPDDINTAVYNLVKSGWVVKKGRKGGKHHYRLTPRGSLYFRSSEPDQASRFRKL